LLIVTLADIVLEFLIVGIKFFGIIEVCDRLKKVGPFFGKNWFDFFTKKFDFTLTA